MLSKVLIFGNSGSGKSTLAKKVCVINDSAHLDLDLIAWQPTKPPIRVPIYESEKHINNFINTHENWVVEGCYADLLTLLLDKADEVIFLNLSIRDCIINARNRPWEAHKYESKQAQDSNLDMLINWISQYPDRDDSFSQKAHVELFNTFAGKKEMYTTNI